MDTVPCRTRTLSRFSCLILAGVLAAGCSPSAERLSGFTADGTKEERQVEAGILGMPSGTRMNEYHLALTSRPHHAGTEANE